jgi:hypothetical protein
LVWGGIGGHAQDGIQVAILRWRHGLSVSGGAPG